MADDKTSKNLTFPLDVSSLPADVFELISMGGEILVSDPVSRPDGGVTYFIGKDIKEATIPALNPVLPDFVSQAETFVLPDSFIAYLTKFKTDTAIVRAVPTASKFVAVLDYHGDARKDARESAVPGRCAHIATLMCPWDPDYAKWRGIFDKHIEQGDLLEFIEDVIHTIGAPLAGDLIDAISNVELDRETKFKSVRNLRNGTIQLTYAESERGSTAVVAMPDTITVITPIFQGGMALQLEVKLRYHLEKGVLMFKLALPGREKIERDGFRTIGDDVQASTSTPVLYAAA